MTKTENYQLPQWEPHDPVRRTDFNAANQVIDAALTALNGDNEANRANTAANTAALEGKAGKTEVETALAGKADRSALEQVQTALSGKAAASDVTALNQSVAALNTAVAAAQSTADAAWSVNNPFFATGSYWGHGDSSSSLKITVGFRPSVIFIGTATNLLAAFGPDQKTLYKSTVTWDDDGVTLTYGDAAYRMDASSTKYYYCAFR